MPTTSNPKEKCPSCEKLILKSNMSRHQKLHSKSCSICSKSFGDDAKLQHHIASVHRPSLIVKKKFSCSSCPLSFSTYYQLLHHKKSIHQGSSPISYEEVDLSIYGDSPALHNELQTVEHFLRDSVLELSKKKVHNFKLQDLNPEVVIEKLLIVYNDLPSAAKVNISFGFVLQNVQDREEFRYYYAADNNPIFLNPVIISDLNLIKTRLRGDDFLPNLLTQRPDTKWKFYCVTNVTFFVFLLSGVPLGCIDLPIPSILLRNPLVKCFVSDSELVPYRDNLCMFRALAYDLYGNEDLQQNTKNLLQQFLSKLRADGADFQGIEENDITILEELIDRNIQIFTILLDDDSKMFAELTRRSSMNRLQTTSLLRYENHICWTADINKFLKKFRCYICDHFYDRSYNLVNHMKNCSESTQHKYPSGAYQLSDTIFDRLEEFNIIVPDELRLFPNLIVYDFESKTVHDSTVKNTELTSWIGKHVPISVSLCSNFNPDTLFICNEDPNQLIRDFVQNLVALSEKSASIMKEKLQTYISQLQEKYYSVRGLVPVMENEQRSMERNFFDNEAGIDHDDDDDQDPETQQYKWELKTLSNLI